MIITYAYEFHLLAEIHRRIEGCINRGVYLWNFTVLTNTMAW